MKFDDKYEKVITIAKEQQIKEKLFLRKPLIPQEHKISKEIIVSDNFVRPRNNKAKIFPKNTFEVLEPWDKHEEAESNNIFED